MKLEVGMYVRTNIGIAKVHTINDNKVSFIKNRNNRVTHYFDVLKEPSHNIIDLIEVGDYVNGELVVRIEKDPFIKEQTNLWTNTTTTNYWGDISLSPIIDKNIKSIVTKEQFAAMQYEVQKD